ncbi:hypothetical protein DMN77_11030 [Paenibacillus sp. 79R4]|nr:hypothetical protein [Paenibacillus sp. 79R4]
MPDREPGVRRIGQPDGGWDEPDDAGRSTARCAGYSDDDWREVGLYHIDAGDGQPGNYSDGDQVADWANEAFRTGIQTGLVTGDGDKLLPQRLLTRAEATVLLERMLIQVGLIDG